MGFFKIKAKKKIMVRVTNIVKLKGAIGIYLSEYEVKIILPDIHPYTLTDAMRMIRKSKNSFLFKN